MLVPVTEILIKTDQIDNLIKIMKKIDELREANPQGSIKVSVEISLRD